MPSSSPGADSLDDDIEIIAMHDIVDKHSSSPEDSDDDIDDDDDASGDAALLGHSLPRQGTNSTKRLWPQIKDVVVESAPTLLLTTVGLMFTGKLLDQVSHWRAMREVDQLIMIIPTILNLKGNLEMNLSARLGTAANVGELDDPKQRRTIIVGSLTLLQVQAAAISFVAACIAIILGLLVPSTTPAPQQSTNATSVSDNSTIPALFLRGLLSSYDIESRRPIPHSHPDAVRHTDLATFIMVASTTMSAACLSGLILGAFMCALIVLCRKFNRNPDNIAPAIASCLGDLVTLCLVGLVSTLLIPFLHTPIPFIGVIVIIMSAVTSLVYTIRNKYARPLLSEGWTPLLGAVIIGSCTGVVLDMFVSKYEGFALLAIVISGLPGAAGSIFVSRLSTALHATALSKYSPATQNQPSSRLIIITLLVVTFPIEFAFLTFLRSIGWLKAPILFVLLSVLFFCFAVFASLLIARGLTNWLWSKNRDPDLYALPIHSALMDLIGQLLLVLCFGIVSLLGAHVTRRS